MTAAATPYRHRTLLPYAAALVAFATVGACTGGDPGPSAKTPPASSPTSTATSSAPTTTASAPSPTPSADPVIAKIPANARPETQAGAEAFSAFYMGQVNVAFTKGDPNALAGLAAANCKICSAFATAAQELKTKGHHHEGTSISVTSSVANSYEQKKASIVVYVTQHPVAVVDRTGKKVDETKAGKGAFLATVTFTDGWTLDRLQVIK